MLLIRKQEGRSITKSTLRRRKTEQVDIETLLEESLVLNKRELKNLQKIFSSKAPAKPNNNQPESESSENNRSYEEEKNHNESSEDDDICVEESGSDSEHSPEINHNSNKRKLRSPKTQTTKRKYNGPAPSQHGMNMNNRENYEDTEGMYFQNQSRKVDYRMMYPRQSPPQPSYKQEDYITKNNQINMIRNYYKNSFFPFSNDLLKDLVNQIDMYVQILIQTLLSTKDVSQQYQLYLLLYEFTKKKEAILRPLKLPKFEVPWVNPDKMAGKENGEALKIQPQVSFYQSPILEYAYRIVNQIGKYVFECFTFIGLIV